MSDQIIRAMVVEDDPAWQQILVEILTDSGLEIDLASNFEAAIETMRARPHRLAVIDLSLSGQDHHNLDGMRVLEALPRYDPNCVAIMLSGYATVEIAVTAMHELGALTCLRKEVFRRATFRHWLDRALAMPEIPGAYDYLPEEIADVEGADGPVPREQNPPEKFSLGQALLVEDDAGWRSLLSELLSDSGYQVINCSSYVEALGQIMRRGFDLAVIDLSLASSLEPKPNQDGYRLLSNPKMASIPTIIVSGYAEPGRIEEAFAEFGLLACLEKQSFSRGSFLTTVQEAQSHRKFAQPFQDLTRREREVLGYLTRGYTNKKIAQHIHVSPNTVKRHLKSIFAKLDVNSRAAATAKAVSAGLSEKQT